VSLSGLPQLDGLALFDLGRLVHLEQRYVYVLLRLLLAIHQLDFLALSLDLLVLEDPSSS
jgi:hypothetical protein